MNTLKLRYERLLTAFLLAFVLGDIYPHPSLAPGVLQSTFERIQQTILSE
ncbi:MAG: hypothetical protein AAGE96_11415 [Cyanobacteria bacterium P01_G01_bin.19]